MPKRILIVAESIDIEDSSGSKANVALIRNLQKLGYSLKVYHYTRKEVRLPGIECVEIKEDRRSLYFFLSRLERYIRYFLKVELYKPLEKKFGFSFTLFNDRDSIINELWKARHWNPDMVLTLSKGGSFRPHHALLKLPIFHNKWVAYIHDPYPMHFYPPPYPWHEPGYRLKEEFMKSIALKAKITAFPSKLLMDWMGKHFRPYQEKGVVVPHQLEPSGKTLEELPDYFKESNFNLVHAGNILNGREPFGLIKAFQKFLKTNPDAAKNSRLIFLGGPSFYSAELKELADILPEFVMTEKTLPFSQVQSIQNKSSINIILEAKSEISPFLPGKFPHCVGANKLILLLGPQESESRRLLGSAYEYWAEIDDIARIVILLEILYYKWKNDPNSLKLERPDLEKYLSLIYLEETMERVLKEIERNNKQG